MTTLNFRANTRLKDLLGRGLILNDNVAIIELIKNSSDANSPEVNITFKNADKLISKSEITIQDYGDGMSLQEFQTKWLNIAFSGKRNKTNNGRAFAGEKGVGRFSCDRLGSRLCLISKSANQDPFEAIIQWNDFEIDDINKEISDIPIAVRPLSNAEYEKSVGQSNNGIMLKINDVRTVWTETKLDLLKKELERFIIDPDNQFLVSLKSEDIKDKKGELVFDHLIKNRLFEKLDEKTTSVHSEIIDNGKSVLTEIKHDGKTLLSFKKNNPYQELNEINIKVQIHYLNPGAKISFKTITGYTSAEYGSVMMFLNGFRVLPYGDPDNDWLALNRRKTQGTSRFLGGREVFGRVEINDGQRKIIPVTSREGIENNAAFRELATYNLSDNPGEYKRGFVHAAFLALETYVVKGLDWDRIEPKKSNYSYDETLNAMLAAVNQIENRDDLKEIKINENRIRALAKEKIIKYDKFIENLKNRVSNKKVYDLLPSEERDMKKFVDRLDSRIQASQATTHEHKRTAQTEKKRRLFAEASQKPASKKNEELIHHMRLLGDIISGELKESLRVLQTAPSKERLQNQGIQNRIQSALFHNDKLLKLARIVAKADFDMMSDALTEDIFSFVQQYLDELVVNNSTLGLTIDFENDKGHALPLSFSPIEVSMLIDNVFENASNASANQIRVSVREVDGFLDLTFKNNGKCLTERFSNEELFNSGITTTTGSGIGLSQVQRIAHDLDAKAKIFNNLDGGISVRIRWKK